MIELGCIACQIRGIEPLWAPEIHHLIDGGKRRGHSESIVLCSYHHRGVLPTGISPKDSNQMFGPSLSENGKLFHKIFGDDDAMLLFQNKLLNNT